MENAVNSRKILKQDNHEPSLSGNRLEGVTTKVEPKAKAKAIITYPVASNPSGKRGAPFAGDEIVWSGYKPMSSEVGEMSELGRNDLATFGEFDLNMTRATVGNEVAELVGRFPVAIESGIGDNMVDIQSLSKLSLSQSAALAGVTVSPSGLSGLFRPVGATIPLDITLEPPVVGIASGVCGAPDSAIMGTILAVSCGSFMRKGFTTVRAYLCNWADIARIVLSGIDLATKLKKAFSATCLDVERRWPEASATDNTGIGMQMFRLFSSLIEAGARTILGVSTRDFLAADDAFLHARIVL